MTELDSAAADFLRQANSALRDAKLLKDNGSASGVVNRAYYAAFYGACALLDSQGLKANSHQAAITLLHREFVHQGKIQRELMLEYTRLFEARMSGDYGATADITSDQVLHSLETARRFLEMVKTLL